MGVTLGIPDSLVSYLIQSSVGNSIVSYTLLGDYSDTRTANGDLTLYELNLKTLYPDLYLLYKGPQDTGGATSKLSLLCLIQNYFSFLEQTQN